MIADDRATSSPLLVMQVDKKGGGREHDIASQEKACYRMYNPQRSLRLARSVMSVPENIGTDAVPMLEEGTIKVQKG